MHHSDLYLQTDTPERLVFAHPYRNGLILAGASAAGWVVLGRAGGGWGLHLFCGALVVFGLLVAARRQRLDFDLRTRTYAWVEGSWRSTATACGSVGDLRGTVLSEEWERIRNRRHRYWKVSLLFRSPERSVSVLTTRSEPEARQRLGHFAAALGIEAIDRTPEAAGTAGGQGSSPPGS